MKHLGDITQLSGYELPVVDCLVGGSPCQDLSVAGKRAGLDGERSGLFMEQIRLVKEMREKDGRSGRSGYLVRPRYLIWENVPGAFSSKNGEDFQAVLEEIVKVVCSEVPPVPIPEKGWPKAGCISGMGDSGSPFSIAWRLHDAQFWGVPQRRKRISLVADFGGFSSPEILFERQGLSGNPQPCGTQGQGAAAGAESRLGTASGIVSKGNGETFLSEEQHMSLSTGGGQAGQGYPCAMVKQPILLESNQNHATVQTDGVSTALPAAMGMGGNVMDVSVDKTATVRAQDHGHPPSVLQRRFSNVTVSDGEVSPTIEAGAGEGGNNLPMILAGTFNQISQSAGYKEDDVSVSVTVAGGSYGGCGGAGYQQGYCFDRPRVSKQTCAFHLTQDPISSGDATPCISQGSTNGCATVGVAYYTTSKASYHTKAEENIVGSLVATDYKDPPIVTAVDCRNGFESISASGSLQSAAGHNLNSNNVCRVNSILRRLTPLECERLQGVPDNWSKYGINEKGEVYELPDSARYKLQGNGIATPFWKWMMKRISAQYERTPTLGSLFDGQATFPMIWESINGKGSALWSSEIEKHAIAVAKYHFPEE